MLRFSCLVSLCLGKEWYKNCQTPYNKQDLRGGEQCQGTDWWGNWGSKCPGLCCVDEDYAWCCPGASKTLYKCSKTWKGGDQCDNSKSCICDKNQVEIASVTPFGSKKLISSNKIVSIGCCNNAGGICSTSATTTYHSSTKLTWKSSTTKTYTKTWKSKVWKNGEKITSGKAKLKKVSVGSRVTCAKPVAAGVSALTQSADVYTFK